MRESGEGRVEGKGGERRVSEVASEIHCSCQKSEEKDSCSQRLLSLHSVFGVRRRLPRRRPAPETAQEAQSRRRPSYPSHQTVPPHMPPDDATWVRREVREASADSARPRSAVRRHRGEQGREQGQL